MEKIIEPFLVKFGTSRKNTQPNVRMGYDPSKDVSVLVKNGKVIIAACSRECYLDLKTITEIRRERED